MNLDSFIDLLKGNVIKTVSVFEISIYIITQLYKKTVALMKRLDYNVFIDWGA
jgi:hypothetical protein